MLLCPATCLPRRRGGLLVIYPLPLATLYLTVSPFLYSSQVKLTVVTVKTPWSRLWVEIFYRGFSRGLSSIAPSTALRATEGHVRAKPSGVYPPMRRAGPKKSERMAHGAHFFFTFSLCAQRKGVGLRGWNPLFKPLLCCQHIFELYISFTAWN